MLYSLMCARIGNNVPSDTGGRYDVNQSFCFTYPNAPNDDEKGYLTLYDLFGRAFGYNVAGTAEARRSVNFTRLDDGMIDDTPDRELYANFMFTIKYIGEYRDANSPLTYQINLPHQLITDVVPALTNKLREVWDADPATGLYPTKPPKLPFDQCDDDFVVINCIAVVGG